MPPPLPPDPPHLQWLEGLKSRGVRLGLPPVRRLCKALGDPQDSLPSILVAGTNGKGSVAASVEAGLRLAGYRTGLFTSPHLVHVRERYRLLGEDAELLTLDAALARVKEAAETLGELPTYFEATTAAAFVLFASSGCNVMVLEVGMGGRLDATNVVQAPQVSVVTRVDLDHRAELGETLAAIASEKAGIFRPGVPAVVAPQAEEARRALCRMAEEAGAPCICLDQEAVAVLPAGRKGITLETPDGSYKELRPSLAGRHQHENFLTALRALQVLRDRGWDIPEEALRAAVETVRLPGRLEWRRGDPDLLLDAAHNPAGAAALARYLEEMALRPVLLFGCMQDKDAAGILRPLLPRCAEVILTRVDDPRAADPVELLGLCDEVLASTARPVDKALALALHRASRLGVPLLVAGSLYLLGEVTPLLDG